MIATQMNSMPRKILGWRKPSEMVSDLPMNSMSGYHLNPSAAVVTLIAVVRPSW
jgi:hypothetical protein